MADERPKTAYELAMERLARKDQEGAAPTRALTEAQKAEIAEVRQVHQSRVAEREILHQAALRKAASYEEIDQLNEALRRDMDRFARERDQKIVRIRGDASPAQ